jgi:transposase
MVAKGGRSVREVSQSLGVSSKSIYSWLRNFSGQSKETKRGESTEALREENTRLKAELKRTKEERDILRKAAAYFAKASE